jgi:adenylate kinase
MSSPGGTILVCGIAGVGKTWLLHAVQGQLTNALIWSAGQIIGEARALQDPEALRSLPAEEIARSQELLVRGFEAMRDEHPNELALLDAHSVIDSAEGLIDIPIVIVRRLGPVGIVHVEDAVQRILERRVNDRLRTRPPRTADQLYEYQRRSALNCRAFAVALRVPLRHVSAGDVAGLTQAIEDIQNGLST